MTPHNNQVKELLAYYLDLKTSPKYAVMINGPWGSGKTYFVDTFAKAHLKDQRYVYVSLYGLSATTMIDEEIYRQLHPVMSSKAMKYVGRVLKGSIKLALKIDLPGSEQSTVNASLPQLDLSDFIKNGPGIIFVFDDVERCRIAMPELLGYVNSFIEHEDAKVILIANEDEIAKDLSTGDDKHRYERIKEKLIGKTLTIEPNVDDAVEAFLQETTTTHKELIQSHRELIMQIHRESGLSNLRSLRQTILDFSRLLSGLKPVAVENEALVGALLERFLIFAIEIRAGSLKPNEIPSTGIDLSAFSGRARTPEEAAATHLRSKYATLSSWDLVLPVETWRSIFETGLFDFAEIDTALALSPYLTSKENMEDWVRLWYGQDQSDDDFAALIDRVHSNLKAKRFQRLGEISHIIGMLLHYQSKCLLAGTPEEILAEGKAQIDQLEIDNRLLNQEEDESNGRRWLGYGLMGTEQPQLAQFLAYIRESKARAKMNALPVEGAALLSLLLEHSARDFGRAVLITNSGSAKFYDSPVFATVDPEAFTNAVIELDLESCNVVSAVFAERYKPANFARELEREKDWVEKVYDLLDAEKKKRAGKVSALRIEGVQEAFKEAINTIASHKGEAGI